MAEKKDKEKEGDTSSTGDTSPTGDNAKEKKPSVESYTGKCTAKDGKIINVPLVYYNKRWMLRYGSKAMAFNASLSEADTSRTGSALYWGKLWNTHLEKSVKTDKDGKELVKYKMKNRIHELSEKEIANRADASERLQKAREKKAAANKAAGIVSKSAISEAGKKKRIDAMLKEIPNYSNMVKALTDTGMTPRGAKIKVTKYAMKNPDKKIAIPKGKSFVTYS